MRATKLLPAVMLLASGCDGTVELPADKAERAMGCALGASFQLVPDIQAAKDGNIPAARYATTHFYVAQLAEARGGATYDGFAKAMNDVAAKAGDDNSAYSGDGYQAACAKAYPNVAKKDVPLPTDQDEAALQCTAVARIAYHALDGSVSDSAAIKAQTDAVFAGTRATIGKIVAAKGLTDQSQFDALFSPYLAKIAGQGPFLSILDSCKRRFAA